MMHLFINALAASAGGGLTYVRNALPFLATTPALKVTIAVGPELAQECRSFPGVDVLELQAPVSRRFWYEQSCLPAIIRKCDANVVLSTGNFALRRCPVRQVLLSRNSIYLSRDFYRDLRNRGEYRMLLSTRFRAMLAKKSITWANVTVAPSQAFASELEQWSGKDVIAVQHGFDRKTFTANSNPLSPEVKEKLNRTAGCTKLLFVSHYNYYRNFETLIRSIAPLRTRLEGRRLRLLLTCDLQLERNPGQYNSSLAAKLVRELRLQDLVVELGPVPYGQLHQLYALADVYVTAAYAETFAHPLVEAMSSGMPIVASDLPVHREICGKAAAYFPIFSPDILADTLADVLLSTEKTKSMATYGLQRSQEFSWKAHVDKILKICRGENASKCAGGLSA